jgi:hypothetical protein
VWLSIVAIWSAIACGDLKVVDAVEGPDATSSDPGDEPAGTHAGAASSATPRDSASNESVRTEESGRPNEQTSVATDAGTGGDARVEDDRPGESNDRESVDGLPVQPAPNTPVEVPAADATGWPQDCETRRLFRAHGSEMPGDPTKYRVEAGAILHFALPEQSNAHPSRECRGRLWNKRRKL